MIARRWWISLAILVVAGISLLAWYRYPSSKPQTIPPNPKVAELEPAVADSIRTMRERVLQEPESGKDWGVLGEVFLANGLMEEARFSFVEAARLESNNPCWPYLIAVAFIVDGDRESALPHLERTIELTRNNDKANHFAHLVLAEAQLNLGRIKEAETHIRHCRDRTPDEPRTRLDSSLLAVALEDWEAARGHLQHCLANPFARKKARIQLAAVCRRLNEFARAEELQKEANQMPNDWDWPDPIDDDYKRWILKKQRSFAMAGELEDQGHFDEATRIARSLVERYPDDDFAHAMLGRLLSQKGDFQGAILSLQKAIELAPQAIHTHFGLCVVLIQKGEFLQRTGNKIQAEAAFQEAANQARLALAIKPDYGNARRALGISLKHLGKPTEAAKELQEAVHCNPENADMHVELAEVLIGLGRKDEARSRYEEALRLAPPHAHWRASAQTRLEELQKDVKK